MLFSNTRRGGVAVSVVCGAVALAAASALFVSSARDTSVRTGRGGDSETAAAPAKKLNDPDAGDILLRRLGFNPEALAAAGLSPEQCDGVLTAMPTIAPVNDRMTLIGQATANLAKANERAVNAPRPAAVIDGVPIQQAPVEEVPTVAQARAVLDGLLDQAFDAAFGSLPAERIAVLRTMRANAGRFDMPACYLVADRTDAEWLALRNALAAQRIAARQGTEVDPRSQTTLSAVDGEPAVATAKAALSAHGESFKTLWETRLTAPRQ